MFLKSPIEQFILLPTSICSGVSNITLFYLIIIFSFIIIILKNFFIRNINNFHVSNIAFVFTTLDVAFITKKIYLLNFIPTNLQYIFESILFEFTNSFKTLLNSSNIFSFFYSIIVAILFILFSSK